MTGVACPTDGLRAGEVRLQAALLLADGKPVACDTLAKIAGRRFHLSWRRTVRGAVRCLERRGVACVAFSASESGRPGPRPVSTARMVALPPDWALDAVLAEAHRLKAAALRLRAEGACGGGSGSGGESGGAEFQPAGGAVSAAAGAAA